MHAMSPRLARVAMTPPNGNGLPLHAGVDSIDSVGRARNVLAATLAAISSMDAHACNVLSDELQLVCDALVLMQQCFLAPITITSALAVGTTVTLDGLTSTELNGCVGCIAGKWTGERYPVNLRHATGEHRHVNVRPHNLRPCHRGHAVVQSRQQTERCTGQCKAARTLCCHLQTMPHFCLHSSLEVADTHSDVNTEAHGASPSLGSSSCGGRPCLRTIVPVRAGEILLIVPSSLNICASTLTAHAASAGTTYDDGFGILEPEDSRLLLCALSAVHCRSGAWGVSKGEVLGNLDVPLVVLTMRLLALVCAAPDHHKHGSGCDTACWAKQTSLSLWPLIAAAWPIASDLASLPLLWSDEDVRELRGTTAGRELETVRGEAMNIYEFVVAPALSGMGKEVLHMFTAPDDSSLRETFLRAVSLVLSRSIACSDKTRQFAPLIGDLFALVPELVAAGQGGSTGFAGGVLDGKGDSDSIAYHGVPSFERFNAAFSTESHFDVRTLASPSANWDPNSVSTMDWSVVRATADLRAGEWIRLSAVGLSTSQWLVKHGNVPAALRKQLLPNDHICLQLVPAMLPADDDTERWTVLRDGLGYAGPGREGSPAEMPIFELSASDGRLYMSGAEEPAAVAQLRVFCWLLVAPITSLSRILVTDATSEQIPDRALVGRALTDVVEYNIAQLVYTDALPCVKTPTQGSISPSPPERMPGTKVLCVATESHTLPACTVTSGHSTITINESALAAMDTSVLASRKAMPAMADDAPVPVVPVPVPVPGPVASLEPLHFNPAATGSALGNCSGSEPQTGCAHDARRARSQLRQKEHRMLLEWLNAFRCRFDL